MKERFGWSRFYSTYYVSTLYFTLDKDYGYGRRQYLPKNWVVR